MVVAGDGLPGIAAADMEACWEVGLKRHEVVGSAGGGAESAGEDEE